MRPRFTPIVSCEHATNHVPPELNQLGLSPEDLAGHHAWDEGARPVAEFLAEALTAPLFLAENSRLVADLNRPEDLPQSVPAVAFGLVVPGNQGLTEAEIEDRLARFHRPYWNAVTDEVYRITKSEPEVMVLHLSVHSFTPEFEGVVRPVDLGVMFDPAYPHEDRLGQAMTDKINSLGYVAEVNQPYDGRAPALVTSCRNLLHAGRYAGIEFEVNQRLLGELDRVNQVLLEAVQAAVASYVPNG